MATRGTETVDNITKVKLWINGKAQNITDGTYNAVPNSIFVHKDTVYVVGYEKNNRNRDVAKLWVNGVPFDLSDGTKNTYARSVFVGK